MLEAYSQQQGRSTGLTVFSALSHFARQIISNSKPTPNLVSQITSSLNSPRIATRRIILEILLCFVYLSESVSLVIPALEALSASNGDRNTPYAYWFKSMEASLAGRGKMGSLVGASDEVKRNAGTEGSLNDYAVEWFRFSDDNHEC